MNTPTLDDIESDCGHLRNLLEVLADHILQNCEFVRDGKRDPQMEIASSLAWIARDLAAKIEADFEAAPGNRSKLAVKHYGEVA